MKSRQFFLGALICMLAAIGVAPATAASSDDYKGNSSSSIRVQDDGGTATIRGRGVANILGDKVEVMNGAVSVNGVPYGPVPAGAEVTYVATKTSRALFVDGKPRGPSAKK